MRPQTRRGEYRNIYENIYIFLWKLFHYLFHNNVSEMGKISKLCENCVIFVKIRWKMRFLFTLTVMFKSSIISDTPKIPQIFPVDTSYKRQNKGNLPKIDQNKWNFHIIHTKFT